MIRFVLFPEFVFRIAGTSLQLLPLFPEGAFPVLLSEQRYSMFNVHLRVPAASGLACDVPVLLLNAVCGHGCCHFGSSSAFLGKCRHESMISSQVY